jgi:DNA invertase Pin-like site-specific DNA recombinase
MIDLKKIYLIREMKLRGHSKYMIAKMLKISRTTVYAYWDDIPYPRCPHCKKLFDLRAVMRGG